MKDGISMHGAERGKVKEKFDRLMRGLNGPDGETLEGKPAYHTLMSLALFWDFIREFQDQEQRLKLSEKYDEQASKLWKQEIDVVDRIMKNPQFQATKYLPAVMEEISTYNFFSELTRKALLNSARAKLNSIK